MHDQSTRIAILKLHDNGLGSRRIAKTLRISRGAVREVLEDGTPEVPQLARPQRAEPFHDDILSLYADCKGNLIRVHEELEKKGASLSYPALTAYCRRHEISHVPPAPAGQYAFAPGQEMQHDTSPHDAKIGGKLRRVQTASLVLCHSRMTFCQLYPRFNRFTCKLFLTEALKYFGGACAVCMIDNTHVVVLHGTGRDMVPVPEMSAFGDRFSFIFKAHEKGDANRSARVEGPFNHIENNFLAGREFKDFEEANREATLWCDKLNARFSSKLHASRRDLFVAEYARLKPLPLWVPEVYELHHRIVDLEGYVTVRGSKYSAPYKLIGRQLELRETKDQIQLYEGPRLIATHRASYETGARITDPAHRPPRGQGALSSGPVAEEREILATTPALASYVAALKQRSHGRGTLVLRRLLRLLRDYPRASCLEALRDAEHYGLYDLERVERMVLKNVSRDFFPTSLPMNDEVSSDD